MIGLAFSSLLTGLWEDWLALASWLTGLWEDWLALASWLTDIWDDFDLWDDWLTLASWLTSFWDDLWDNWLALKGFFIDWLLRFMRWLVNLGVLIDWLMRASFWIPKQVLQIEVLKALFISFPVTHHRYQCLYLALVLAVSPMKSLDLVTPAREMNLVSSCSSRLTLSSTSTKQFFYSSAFFKIKYVHQKLVVGMGIFRRCSGFTPQMNRSLG